MNYNLNTDEGLQNAVRWTNSTMALLSDGGRWAVPRSGTIITVVNRLDKQYDIISDTPDPTLIHVLGAAGWTIRNAIINTLGDSNE